MKRVISILLLLIFALSLPLSNVNLTKSKTLIPSTTTFYDLVANADKANWSSGAGTLPWPGSLSDSRGFATYRTQIKLEDNQTYSKVLETHPQWVDTGWIQGIYPQITVPTNAKLNIKVGLINGANSDGVIFRVYFQQGQTRQTLIDQRSYYDGHLDSVSFDLSTIAGKTGNFILYVNALKSSGQDWAVWVNATIDQTSTLLPDLTVSKIYCSADNRITITLANIGTVTLPSGYDGIVDVYIDGTKVTWFKLTTVPTFSTGGGIAKPGGTSTYEIATQITKTSTVKVVVDSTNSIAESNEANNTMTAQVEPCAKLPDLVIAGSTCNYEKKSIEFILKNVGAGKVDKSFNMTLYVDGVSKETKRITATIDPGNVYSSNFETYVLTCYNAKIKIIVDASNEIPESDETNNSLEKECKCEAKDTTPPKITKGPDVSKITQTSVVLTWDTDEESDSKILYGDKFQKLDKSKEDKGLVKNHSLTLLDLLPATVYTFVVESKDASGNSVQSKEKLFETLPEEDKEKPTISLILPEKLSGTAKIKANVNDNKGVDRVIFYVDGKPMFTDFSPPFEWNLDTKEFPDGNHSFSAAAFDAAGNIADVIKQGSTRNRFPLDVSPIKVTILEPASHSEVYGFVQIEATITSDIGSCITRAEIWINETLTESYNFPCLSSPIHTSEGGWYSGPSIETISYIWNTADLFVGNYFIEIRAWDDLGNEGRNGTEVYKVREPEVSVPLGISRRVTRTLNYFEVELTITNTYSGPSNSYYTLYNFTVTDKSKGFQAVNEPGLNIANNEALLNKVVKNLGPLSPGSSKTLSYKVVPFLRSPFLAFCDYWIGENELNVSYNDSFGRSYSYNYPSPVYSSSIEVQNAFSSADYLIVTSPESLYSTYDRREVDTLLSTMAELAKEKYGVLGYLPSGVSPDFFKNLIRFGSDQIREGGGWINRWSCYLQSSWDPHNSSWVYNGYLLIVGEDSIVPSWTVPTTEFTHENGGYISCSDYPYADTCSDDGRPNLKVGRIVGNDAAALIKPIRASIDVYKHKPGHIFNRSNAILVSGKEDTWEQFVYWIIQIGDILRSQGITPDYVHREYYATEVEILREALVIRGDYETTDCTKTCPPKDLPTLLTKISIEEAIRIEEDRRNGDPPTTYNYSFANDTESWDYGTNLIASKMNDKDIYFWDGHGGPGPMYEFVGHDFGSHHPVVFADSCLTGIYKDIIGNPECSFDAGAAVYIGATEVSPADSEHGFEFGRKYFANYWTSGTSCGDALTSLKDWMWQTGDSLWQYEAQEYNLYGDPKFGGD